MNQRKEYKIREKKPKRKGLHDERKKVQEGAGGRGIGTRTLSPKKVRCMGIFEGGGNQQKGGPRKGGVTGGTKTRRKRKTGAGGKERTEAVGG